LFFASHDDTALKALRRACATRWLFFASHDGTALKALRRACATR
jgi:hypothetical protein